MPTHAPARQSTAGTSGARDVSALVAQKHALDQAPRVQALGQLRTALKRSRHVTQLTQLTSKLQPRHVPSHPGIIQRAVGFEFEDESWSTWALQPGKRYAPFFEGSPAPRPPSKSAYPGENIYDKRGSDHVNDSVGKYNLESAGKKALIHKGPFYKIEPDGPYKHGRMDMEFVTDPFPETPDGYGQLSTALEYMSTVVARLDGLTGRDHNQGAFVTPREHGFVDQEIYLSGGTKGGAFKVQATQGLPLRAIPELMRVLGSNVPGENEVEARARRPMRHLVRGQDRETIDTGIMGGAPARAQTAVRTLAASGVLTGAPASPVDVDTGALEGLLSMMIMYLQLLTWVSSKGVKEKLSFMSRHSFATLFTQLPAQQQEQLKASPDNFVTALSVALGGTRAANLSDSLFNLQENALANDDGIVARSMLGALMSITREQWIKGILNGRDLLKAEDMMAYLQRDAATDAQKAGARDYGKSIAIFLRGHGDTGRVTETGDRERLAVFENRSIERPAEKEMTMSEAREFALEYFQMLEMIRRKGYIA